MTTVVALIPTFNRARFLSECINSVLSQTRPPDEVIVIDDGSTDHTPAVLSEWAGLVRVLRKENGGKSTALNLGLEHTDADLVWICDDDDIACPDALARLEVALDAAPNAPFAYGKFQWFFEKDGQRHYQHHSNYGRLEEPSFFLNALEEMFAFQFAMLVRRSAYKTVGPFRTDLHRSQDFEMLARLTRIGDPVFVPHTVFLQRRHNGPRGPAGERISAAQTFAKSIQYGGRVLTDFRRALPLEAFVPGFARGWSEHRDRAALLQLGVTFAKRAMWTEALDELEAAVALDPDAMMTAEEHRLPRQVIRTHSSWVMLATQPEAITRLRLLTQSRFGKAIARAIVAAAWNRAAQAGRQRHHRNALVTSRLATRLTLTIR